MAADFDLKGDTEKGAKIPTAPRSTPLPPSSSTQSPTPRSSAANSINGAPNSQPNGAPLPRTTAALNSRAETIHGTVPKNVVPLPSPKPQSSLSSGNQQQQAPQIFQTVQNTQTVQTAPVINNPHSITSASTNPLQPNSPASALPSTAPRSQTPNGFQPPPSRRSRDTFTPDADRRRRLTEYEKSLRREANELEDDPLLELENIDLIQRQIRGRKKKAILPAKERPQKLAIFKGNWRKRYRVHARTKARLEKYKTSIGGIMKSVAKAFSGKRGGNKQS